MGWKVQKTRTIEEIFHRKSTETWWQNNGRIRNNAKQSDNGRIDWTKIRTCLQVLRRQIIWIANMELFAWHYKRCCVNIHLFLCKNYSRGLHIYWSWSRKIQIIMLEISNKRLFPWKRKRKKEKSSWQVTWNMWW